MRRRSGEQVRRMMDKRWRWFNRQTERWFNRTWAQSAGSPAKPANFTPIHVPIWQISVLIHLPCKKK